MRVLAIHRYYWPDTPPYASVLHSIVKTWSAAGHRVDVFSTQPSYKPETPHERRPRNEIVDGATVRRVRLAPDYSGRVRRLINQVLFPMYSAMRILVGPRYDLVMCSTSPPVLLGAAVSFATRLRGARFVYHCMDLHPEIGALSGDFSNPLLRRVLARLELITCRRAWRIIVLSDDMRRSVLTRDPDLEDRVLVVRNFDVPDFDQREVDSPLPPGDRLRLVFAGNLGRFQGLDIVTRAVLSDDQELDRLEFVLMGDGAVKTDLIRLVEAASPEQRERVRLLPHGTAAEANALVQTAHLGLVSLTPGVIRYACPTKTATYLASGVPVLAMVEADSSLATMIVSEGIGRRIDDDIDMIRRVLVELATRPETLVVMRDRAVALWEREFSSERLLPEWRALLEGVA